MADKTLKGDKTVALVPYFLKIKYVYHYKYLFKSFKHKIKDS